MSKVIKSSGVFTLGVLGGDRAAVTGDDHWNNVTLLLDGSGTNGSTTITDKSSASTSITASGNAAISTSVQKYGTGSYAFDGTGDYLTINGSSTSIDLSGDFTLETWVYFNTTTGNQKIFDLRLHNVVGTADTLLLDKSGTQFRCYVDGENRTVSSPTASANTWYHVAVSRSGSIVRHFVNGTAYANYEQSTVKDYTIDYGAHIGISKSGQNFQFGLNGYMDDIRFTSGVARYTQNFTPPAGALPTNAAVTAVSEPTRKWGGLVGRSLIASDQLAKTGNLKLSELFQAKISTPPPTHVSSNLVMHIDAGNTSSYPGSGTTVTDIEGGTRTMTLNGGVTYQTANGGQFNFDGTDDYMSTSTSGLNTGTVAFSLELLVNFDQFQTTRWWLAVVGQYGTGALHLIGKQGLNSTRQYGVWSGGQISGVIGASAGAWQQIVVTHDGTSTLKLYENNTLIGTNTSASQLNFTNDDLSIGLRNGSESYFDGKMTILRLYDKELTAAEVQNNYDVDKARHGLS